MNARPTKHITLLQKGRRVALFFHFDSEDAAREAAAELLSDLALGKLTLEIEGAEIVDKEGPGFGEA